MRNGWSGTSRIGRTKSARMTGALKQMLTACSGMMAPDDYRNMLVDVLAARQDVQQRTAWRVDCTLREFGKPKPVNLWFNYPTHQVDTTGVLKDQESEGDKPPWQKAMEKRKPKEKKAKDRKVSTENAYENCSFDGEVALKNMAEYLGITEKSVRNRLTELGNYEIKNGYVTRKKT